MAGSIIAAPQFSNVISAYVHHNRFWGEYCRAILAGELAEEHHVLGAGQVRTTPQVQVNFPFDREVASGANPTPSLGTARKKLAKLHPIHLGHPSFVLWSAHSTYHRMALMSCVGAFHGLQPLRGTAIQSVSVMAMMLPLATWTPMLRAAPQNVWSSR